MRVGFATEPADRPGRALRAPARCGLTVDVTFDKGQGQGADGRRAAFLVVAAGVSAALHVAKLAPAIPLLRAELGLSLVQAGFLLSAVQVASMLLGAVLGLFADQWGLRRCLLIGLAMLVVTSTLGPTVPEAGFMLFLRALEGVGFLLVFMPCAGLIRQLVSAHDLPFMLGVFGICMPLATALALLGGPLLLPLMGWPQWWWLMAALSAAMAVATLVWVPSDALRARLAGAGATPGAAGSKAPRPGLLQGLGVLRLTLSSEGPWLVALSFAFYASQWQAVMGFLPSIYASSELGIAWTAVLTALAAAANIVGNLAAGVLLQRGVPAARVLSWGFASMALGAWFTFESFWPLAPGLRYGALLVFSMMGGLIPGSLFSLAVRLAPRENAISTTVGWMTQCSALGQFVGPPLVGWVAGLAGGWQWTWGVTGASCVAGLLLAWRIARRLALP